MIPLALKNPAVLGEPWRPFQLSAKAGELLALLAANPNMSPGDALAAVTNAYWELQISQLPDAISLVGYIGQFSTKRGPSYSIMTGAPTYDSDGNILPHELHNCYKGHACEIAFDAADMRYVDFLAAITAAAPGFLQAGYISVRFCAPSRALLSMQNVTSAHAIGIEVSAFKGMLDSARWIEFLLQMAQAFGGRPHWGQLNHPSAAQVKELYGDRFDRWRAVLGGFSGNSTLFSSAFTISRGLEPQGARAIKIEGTAEQLTSNVDAAITLLLLDDDPARKKSRHGNQHSLGA
jgi:hypothetical protein